MAYTNKGTNSISIFLDHGNNNINSSTKRGGSIMKELNLKAHKDQIELLFDDSIFGNCVEIYKQDRAMKIAICNRNDVYHISVVDYDVDPKRGNLFMKYQITKEELLKEIE